LHSHSVLVSNSTRRTHVYLFRLRSIENKGLSTFTTILAIFVSGHEDSSATFLAGAFTTESVNLSVFVDLRNSSYSLVIGRYHINLKLIGTV